MKAQAAAVLFARNGDAPNLRVRQPPTPTGLASRDLKYYFYKVSLID
jgi:hypothetical protein